MDLKDKTALVTGAATGIGLEYVKIMLTNGLKRAALLDINSSAGVAAAEQLNKQFGDECVIFILCDASNQQHMEDAFKKAIETFKKLDIVVNNAGIMRDSVWEQEIAINLAGVVRGSILALDHMGKDRGGAGGTLVNISSLAGLTYVPTFPVYGATKHAVVAFSRIMGMPYHEARTGVRVLVLCPGMADTPLTAMAPQHLLRPEWAPEYSRFADTLPPLSKEEVAEAFFHMLQHGRSASIWVIKSGEPVFEIRPAHYESLKV